MTNDSILFYRMIRDYLSIFLSKQKGASHHTVRSYKTTLNQFTDYMASYLSTKLNKLSFSLSSVQLIESFLDDGESNRHWSVKTRNQKLAAIRSFYKYASSHDTTLTVYYLEIKNVSIKKEIKGMNIDFFTEETLKIILAQPDPIKPKDMRNLVMMILMYDTGARIQELLDLKVKNLYLNTSTPYVMLIGKGSKTRLVPIMNKTVNHLNNYMRQFHSDLSDYDVLLFYTIHNGMRTQMSQDNMQIIIDRYCKMAINKGVDVPTHIYSHMFRHSRAMHLYRNGMPLPLVSEWLGHAQLSTTREFYANADIEMKRTAINAATSKLNPIKLDDYEFDFDNDDELLKKLYGLK